MLIDARNMVGNFMAVFASAKLKEQIKNVETESVKCGLAKKGADVGMISYLRLLLPSDL